MSAVRQAHGESGEFAVSAASTPPQTSGQPFQHFGSLLKHERVRRAFTLDEVSERTKIPLRALECLESGDLGGLPAPVFVRGFIRSYARLVGVDERVALAEFARSPAAAPREQLTDSS